MQAKGSGAGGQKAPPCRLDWRDWQEERSAYHRQAVSGPISRKVKVTPAVSGVIEAVLFDVGYERLGEGVYKALWSTIEVEHFLYVSSDPKGRGIVSGDFGIRNDVAEAFSCNAIHAYGGEIFKLFKCAEPTTCAMRFSFGRLEPRGWPIRRAIFSGKEVGERFLTLVTEHLIPTVGHVGTLADLLALLVADMSYCPWLGTNGAIRAAQVVALAGQIGLGAAHIHAMLESRMLLIAHGGSKMSEVRTNPTAYLDRLFEDWAARAN
jgi:hypothetical protein